MSLPNDKNKGKTLLVALEQFGKGCISGRVYEWPQLIPACKWAADEISTLKEALRVAEEALLRKEAKGYLKGLEDERQKAKGLVNTIQAIINNNDGEPYREFARQSVANYEARKNEVNDGS